MTAWGGAVRHGVSYVMTVYNKRPFLAALVAGLAAQRGEFAREFIFIDDGSTDGSGTDIERLTAGWREVTIIHQMNQGLSHATNRGMAAARHPFIKLVDADDVLLPDATAILLDALLRHPGAVLAHGQTGLYGTPEEAIAQLAIPHTTTAARELVHHAPLRWILRHHVAPPSACLYATAAVRAAGGCDPDVFCQDFSLALKLATIGAFVVSDAVVALFPIVAEGRINDAGPQCLHDTNLALANFLAEHSVPQASLRMAVRRATARAYRWARRREGAGIFSYWTWLWLRGLLPSAKGAPALLRQSCGAFTLSQPVRPGTRPAAA